MKTTKLKYFQPDNILSNLREATILRKLLSYKILFPLKLKKHKSKVNFQIAKCEIEVLDYSKLGN